MPVHYGTRVVAVAGLLLGALISLSHPRAARALGGWVPATEARGGTLLADGRVLSVRYTYDATGTRLGGTTHIYDPVTGRAELSAPMDAEEGNEAAVLLPDGRVLFSGGDYDFRSLIGKAQVYDPATDRWAAVEPVGKRTRHTATLLADGTVLVVGGGVTEGSSPSPPTDSVRHFNPPTGRWSRAAPLLTNRESHTATLLRDGRLLVTGGYTAGPDAYYRVTAAAEVYDPVADTWQSAGSMSIPRVGHQATLLPDGRVLVTGDGHYHADQNRFIVHAEAELYDPAANRWSAATPLLEPRSDHSAVLLPNGLVLVLGGSGPLVGTEVPPLTTTELYDPHRDVWAPAAPLLQPYPGSATLLRDGRVLVGGALYLAERPPVTCLPAPGPCISGRFLDYWQAHGGLAANGYPLTDVCLETLEDGRSYQVQYFERVRLEYHPGNGTSGDVLLGQFGRRFHPADPPAPPLPGARYFPATGHNVARPAFLAYWEAHGGLAQFGYPLTEEFTETLEDNRSYTVQYFERARFEWHPENAGTPYEVLLGQLGRLVLATK